MIKKVLVCLFNFISIILLILAILLIVFDNTILNKKYIINKLKSTNYYNFLYEDINSSINSLSMQLRIGDEENILNDVVDKNQVKKDLNSVVNSFFSNKKIRIDEDKFNDKVSERINSVLEKNNRVLNDSEVAAINKLKQELFNDYKGKLLLSEKYMTKISKYYYKIKNTLGIVEIILLISNIVVIGFIYYLSRNIKNILLVSGVICMLMKYIDNKIHNILFLNKYMSKFVVSILQGYIDVIMIIGIVLVIIYLIISIKKNLKLNN